ncbi:hypothetical protein TYRP_000826, partial [Tyrophagus putrescentiae]
HLQTFSPVSNSKSEKKEEEAGQREGGRADENFSRTRIFFGSSSSFWGGQVHLDMLVLDE